MSAEPPRLEPAVQMKKASDGAEAVYDALLELDSFLAVFDTMDNPPKWVFCISRSVSRLVEMASLVHGDVLRIPGMREACHGSD